MDIILGCCLVTEARVSCAPPAKCLADQWVFLSGGRSELQCHLMVSPPSHQISDLQASHVRKGLWNLIKIPAVQPRCLDRACGIIIKEGVAKLSSLSCYYLLCHSCSCSSTHAWHGGMKKNWMEKHLDLDGSILHLLKKKNLVILN